MKENRFANNNGSLKDKKIADMLRKAADSYENGEIVEVLDTINEIAEALEIFIQKEENDN